MLVELPIQESDGHRIDRAGLILWRDRNIVCHVLVSNTVCLGTFPLGGARCELCKVGISIWKARGQTQFRFHTHFTSWDFTVN